MPSVFSEPYWAGCAAGELRFQRCQRCGGGVHTPAAVCSACGDDELMWETSSGRGVIHSFTIVWRPVTPAFVVPYAPVVIEMEEGWHLLTALIDCDTEEVSIDAAVDIVFRPLDDGFLLPYARPV
jgi:uncharacterized OB-fold protein